MDSWGLYYEFSSRIHLRFLCHFLSTSGYVHALGLCGKEYGIRVARCMDSKGDYQREHIGEV